MRGDYAEFPWPIRLKPLNGEILSSWIVRLAKAHRLKLHTFCSLYWPKKEIWTRDVDRSADDNLISGLCAGSLVSYHDAYETTLKSFEGTLYESCNRNSFTPWILPAGVYHRVRKRRSMQYCPYCIRKDRIPYFRKIWRMALFPVCLEHKCVLLDSCQLCNAPVSFHRIKLEYGIDQCWRCGADMGMNVPGSHGDNKVLTQCVLSCMHFQQYMLTGWADFMPDNPIRAPLFFNGLRQIAKVVLSVNMGKKLRRQISDTSGLKPLCATNENGFENLKTQTRIDVLAAISWLIGDWPDRIDAILGKSHMRRSDWLKDGKNLPFWYVSALN